MPLAVVSMWAFLLLGLPFGAVAVARSVVVRRETAQKLLTAEHNHLRPSKSWQVAYATGAHMESLFKFWSWEDVGVLHLYDSAVAFYGEKTAFEVDRDSLESVRVTTYFRTNPLVPWIELRTTGGLAHFFCVPKGFHVFGMRHRAEDIHRAIEMWSRGSSARPLRIE